MTWEERFHPLRREWVVVAAHRQERPWLGNEVVGPTPDLPAYVEDCYFCPGNVRVSGLRNDDYENVYVFDNDHPCVGPDAPTKIEKPGEFYRNRPATGLSQVVCYSPLHNVTLAELEITQIEILLRTWQEQYVELGDRPEVEHVLIFENKGEVVGVSNPHPHCQIYATNFQFKTIENEAVYCREHYRQTGRVLFEEIIAAEVMDGRRVICENDSAIAFQPYFSRYAYEVYVAPKQCHRSIAGLSAGELSDLARVLREMLVRYDNLWQMPFPYVMALHQAPTNGEAAEGFHFHIELHPPLRKPNLLKYLAGPEIGGGCFLCDTAPEQTAKQLREVSTVHYKQAARE